MVKLTPTGVKINTNLGWTSHNTGGVEFNTGVFALFASKCHGVQRPAHPHLATMADAKVALNGTCHDYCLKRHYFPV